MVNATCYPWFLIPPVVWAARLRSPESRERNDVMRIRFWGTRGSLPAASEAAVIRDKIKRALLKADGRRFADETALEHFIDTELEFPVRGGYGGNTSSVEII